MKEIDIKKISDLALELHEKGEYVEAEKYFLEALYLMDEKDNQLYQKVVYGLGINYAMQQNYEGAKSCFQEGRLNAQKANNMEHELEMLHELIKICRLMNDSGAAEILANEEIMYREKYVPNDFEGLSVAHYEKALVFIECHHPIKSEAHLKKALEYAKKSNEKISIAYLQAKIGDYYQSMGKKIEAKNFYLKSLDLFRELDDQRNMKIIAFKIDDIEETEDL
ncbi:tetratricopeptide repeat protein [Jeotgalibaca ciconiae]|uniref:Tetratricopeptide repeat protein n=1 Tax=Jeotgalibaca ciconiae TaxID=2496265 RepID=A0A3Q9BIX2_9LACT|nr:hypothetical protein [Jeotgalibaca ciconiae]AZP03427.1 hypothetical protein EJN90_01395 [Jeotgalibaca ciconiae]